MKKTDPAGGYRAKESFAVAADGWPRVIGAGTLIADDDPIVKTHRGLLQPVSEYIEQTTARPGEHRPVHIPDDPSQQRQGEEPMPHTLPPEDPDSPASTFAPVQPAAGVVADDVEAKGQNLAGGPTAAAATKKGLGSDYAEKQTEANEKADAPGERNSSAKPASKK